MITRNDYVQVDTFAGTLPDGTPYSVPVFDLTAAATDADTGGSLLVNSEAEREYMGVNVNFTKRLSNRWMARGYLNWAETIWNLDDGFFLFDDPTNISGSFDDDGAVFAEQSAGSGNKGDIWLQSTWSANLNGMYQVAPDRPWGFNLSASVQAREGYPIVYFDTTVTSDDENRNIGVLTDYDDFRLDDVATVDLRVEKEFALTSAVNFTFGIDVFNVTNEGTELNRQRNLDATNRFFLADNISPRIYRLGVRLGWK
jgi:hypothetical protein